MNLNPPSALGPIWDMTMSWSPAFRDEKYLGELQAAGVHVVGLTIASDRTQQPGLAIEAIQEIEATLVRRLGYRLVRTIKDVDRAVQEGQLAFELNFQGTAPLGGDVDQVDGFYAMGVRHMGLVWNESNDVGGSSAAEPDQGLTAYGKEVVRRMNDVGVVVDGAHTGFKTILDAIDISFRPVVISHMNCHSVAPVPKNIPDHVIRACAQTGGVLGVSGFGFYAGDYEAATTSIFRHVDHIAQLVGVDHVGLGLDYVAKPDVLWRMVQDAPSLWPGADGASISRSQFFGVHRWQELRALLIQHGYSDEDIAKVLGGNWRRVCAAAWA